MDATADGSRLVIVGNFLKVGGVDHSQVAHHQPGEKHGHAVGQSGNREPVWRDHLALLRRRGDQPGWHLVRARGPWRLLQHRPLDTVTRWELQGQDTSAHPTWTNWTGGDTLWSVAVTPAAVYVAGHPRWLDNYGCNNEPCPDAVAREGIAAVDPADGSVLPWNPGRSRGVGAQELVVTQRGLYVGSDTERLGDEFHARLGLFPPSP